MGLEINIYNKRILNPNLTNITMGNVTKTLDTLITADYENYSNKFLNNVWRGAEAWHFYILSMRMFKE